MYTSWSQPDTYLQELCLQPAALTHQRSTVPGVKSSDKGGSSSNKEAPTHSGSHGPQRRHRKGSHRQSRPHMPGANIDKGKTKKWHTYVTYMYLLLVSILGTFQKTSGHGSGQVALLQQGCWTRLLQEVPSDHGHSVISLSLLSRALWIALGKQQDPVCCQDSPQCPWFLAGTTISLQSSPQYKCRLTGKVLQQ